ncbi:hypothetical protein [Nitrospirillum sp. BR 11828]|uniref:hypothetical protein n=1 Tax=Nitrospirillum sp. BR 11828 TaxID=3104325 RepID=UPI002ACAEFAB|nr:hypothetical protein [Nitrospirillum sp. BR 11828]MDZ5650786.1 hypothetical protein [Nitrospirillum sp. BR 11828]
MRHARKAHDRQHWIARTTNRNPKVTMPMLHKTSGPLDASIRAPGWDRLGIALSLTLALAWTILICQTVWPGLMSFDSLLAYRQSIDGIDTAISPPMHDYLFYLSRLLSGGPGGLLVIQSFGLFFSANLIIYRAAKGAALATGLMLVFAAAFLVFPTMLGSIIVLWKDVPVATFSLVAICIWISCLERFSATRMVYLFLCLTIVISLRYNALPIVLPFMALVVLNPAGPGTTMRRRMGAVLGGVLAMSIAYGSTLWRLPDFQRLPPVEKAVAAIKLWDIVGISACEGENLLPEGVEAEPRFSAADLKTLYDPRHANLTLKNPVWRAHMPPNIAQYAPAIETRWRELLVGHTACYLKTRTRVLRQQLGLGTAVVHYPTHDGIDENIYGLKLSRPDRTNALVQKILHWSSDPVRRPYILYILSMALAVAAMHLNKWRLDLLLAINLGNAGFLSFLYFVAPAADARYLFPSNVFCALSIALSLAVLAQYARAWLAWNCRSEMALASPGS